MLDGPSKPHRKTNRTYATLPRLSDAESRALIFKELGIYNPQLYDSMESRKIFETLMESIGLTQKQVVAGHEIKEGRLNQLLSSTIESHLVQVCAMLRPLLRQAINANELHPLTYGSYFDNKECTAAARQYCKWLREDRGISQAKLAAAACVTESVMERFEGGKYVYPQQARNILRALGKYIRDKDYTTFEDVEQAAEQIVPYDSRHFARCARELRLYLRKNAEEVYGAKGEEPAIYSHKHWSEAENGLITISREKAERISLRLGKQNRQEVEAEGGQLVTLNRQALKVGFEHLLKKKHITIHKMIRGLYGSNSHLPLLRWKDFLRNDGKQSTYTHHHKSHTATPLSIVEIEDHARYLEAGINIFVLEKRGKEILSAQEKISAEAGRRLILEALGARDQSYYGNLRPAEIFSILMKALDLKFTDLAARSEEILGVSLNTKELKRMMESDIKLELLQFVRLLKPNVKIALEGNLDPQTLAPLWNKAYGEPVKRFKLYNKTNGKTNDNSSLER